MPRRELELSNEERLALEQMRDRAPKPYLRERAAALLQIAEGKSGYWVAQYGLLKPRAPDTVYEWLNRYEKEGIAGLYNRPGRGRKPAFFPSGRGGSTQTLVAHRAQTA